MFSDGGSRGVSKIQRNNHIKGRNMPKSYSMYSTSPQLFFNKKHKMLAAIQCLEIKLLPLSVWVYVLKRERTSKTTRYIDEQRMSNYLKSLGWTVKKLLLNCLWNFRLSIPLIGDDQLMRFLFCIHILILVINFTCFHAHFSARISLRWYKRWLKP